MSVYSNVYSINFSVFIREYFYFIFSRSQCRAIARAFFFEFAFILHHQSQDPLELCNVVTWTPMSDVASGSSAFASATNGIRRQHFEAGHWDNKRMAQRRRSKQLRQKWVGVEKSETARSSAECGSNSRSCCCCCDQRIVNRRCGKQRRRSTYRPLPQYPY